MRDLRALLQARDFSNLHDAARSLGLEADLRRPLTDLRLYVARDKVKWLDTLIASAPPEDPKTVGSALSGKWLERGLRATPGATHWVPLAFKHLLLDSAGPEPGPSKGAKPTDARELTAWAEALGVADELFTMARVSSDGEAGMWNYSAARVLTRDLLLGEGKSFEALCADLGLYAVRKAQASTWESLEKLAQAREEARKQELAKMSAEAPPSDPGARALYDWLHRAHQRVRERFPPDVTPRGTVSVSIRSIAPPILRVLERDTWGSSRYVDLLLAADDPGDLRVSCLSCGAAGFEARDPCAHTAEALRDAASALASEPASTFAPLLVALERPSWERFFEEALARPDEAEPHRTAIGFRVLPGDNGGLTLELLLVTQTARGGTKTKKATPEHLQPLLDAESTPPNVRAAMELLMVDYSAQTAATWARWRPKTTTAHPALLSLVDYPFVFAKPERADVPIRVELTPPRLRIERDETGRTTFGARLGAEPMALSSFIARLKASTHGSVLAVLDLEDGVCRVGRVSSDLVRLAARLDLGNLRAPPEATEPILRRLEPFESRGIVERDTTVKGPRAPADDTLFWRLVPDPEMRLTVELRVRPVASGPSFRAGEGPEEVYGRDAQDRIFHAVRAMEVEVSQAHALARAAPLEPREGAPFAWTVAHDAAAEFLTWLEANSARAAVEWERSRWRLGRPTNTRDLKLAIRKERDWFNISGGLEVDGVRVDLAVLLEAARAERRFILVGEDQWVPLSRELRERIERLSDFTSPSKQGVALNPLAAPVVRELGAEAEIEAEAAWADLEARFARADALVPELPSDLVADLRPYQREGFGWMARLSAWGVGACLADDMGLGKTLQALAIVLARSKDGPTLVVAPTSVCFNWRREASRFTPNLNAKVYAELPRDTREGAVASAGPRDLVIVSYGLLVQDRLRFAAKRWTTLVLDEAQAIKNSETRRAHAVRDLDVEWALALSGTPIENHLGELWSLMRRLVPGLLGTQDFFRERYALPIERKDGASARALARVIKPFVLRRTKAEVATDLPPRTDILVEIELEPRHRQLYEDARLAAAAEIVIPTAGAEREQSRFQMLAALTRLRQLACHPRLVEPESTLGSAKMTRLLELLGTLVDEGHQALVFSQFVRHLDLVEPELEAAGIAFVRLDGSTSALERARRVDAFQSGEAKVFLLSLKAGGTGLNLTAADYVLHLDPWWNPAAEDQATDRAHRIGQARPVTVYRLIARGTVEAQILRMHEEKRELVESLLAGTDSAGKLSLEELADLVRFGGEVEGLEAEAISTPPRPAPIAEATLPAPIAEATRPAPPRLEAPARPSFSTLVAEFAAFLRAESELFDFAPGDDELERWREAAEQFAAFADDLREDPQTADLEALGRAFLRERPKGRRRPPSAAVEAFIEFVAALQPADGPSAASSSVAHDQA